MSGPASLDRPEGGVVLRELHGTVALPPAVVHRELAARLDPRGQSAFLVDHASSSVVVQGDYWYRGEYRVTAIEGGSAVSYTIVNVAPGSKLLGSLTGRGEVRAAPAAFARLLRAIEDQRAT